MADELKPCPLCYGTELDQWPCEWLDGSGNNVVRCAHCHCAAPMKAWNTRHQPNGGAGAEDARDAARYRWLRDEYDPSFHDDEGNPLFELSGAALDRSVDSLMQEDDENHDDDAAMSDQNKGNVLWLR